LAEDFVLYLWSAGAQKIFCEKFEIDLAIVNCCVPRPSARKPALIPAY